MCPLPRLAVADGSAPPPTPLFNLRDCRFVVLLAPPLTVFTHFARRSLGCRVPQAECSYCLRYTAGETDLVRREKRYAAAIVSSPGSRWQNAIVCIPLVTARKHIRPDMVGQVLYPRLNEKTRHIEIEKSQSCEFPIPPAFDLQAALLPWLFPVEWAAEQAAGGDAAEGPALLPFPFPSGPRPAATPPPTKSPGKSPADITRQISTQFAMPEDDRPRARKGGAG